MYNKRQSDCSDCGTIFFAKEYNIIILGLPQFMVLKNVYAYDIEAYFIKYVSNCINTVNGPMWYRLEMTLYTVKV